MALVTKRAGAPAGTIRASVGASTYIFDDAANLQVDVTLHDDYVALVGHPYFQAVGGGGVTPPSTSMQPVVVTLDGSETVGSVPTIQGDGSIRFKPVGGVPLAASADPFRFDSSRLGQLRAALAARSTTPVDYLFIGDSVTEGQSSTDTATWATRWQGIFMAAQRTRWQPVGVAGGRGYVPAAYAAGSMATSNIIVFAGTTSGVPAGNTGFGLGERYKKMNAAATATISVPAGVTSVDLMFAVGTSAGTYSYTLDGGASQGPFSTVSTGVFSSGHIKNVVVNPAGTHTIVVTANTTAAFLEGIYLYNGDETKGLRSWDSGHSGWRTVEFTGSADPLNGWVASNWGFSAYRYVQPDVVSIALGLNDYGTNTSGNRVNPRVYGRLLQELVDGVRGQMTVQPSIILWEPYVRTDDVVGNGGNLLGRWADYVQAVRRVARDDGNITIFDSNAVGAQLGTDALHPTVAGHATLGNALDTLVAAA